MKQQFEAIAKVFNLKETQTKGNRWLYSFTVPIEKEDLAEWLQVAILQDTQRSELLQAKELHFKGELTPKAAYGNKPQGLSVFGFYVEPVFVPIKKRKGY